jgi:hypothetical protein
MPRYVMLIRHPSAARVLTVTGADGQELPSWSSDVPHFWQASDHIITSVRQQWDLRIQVLRCVGLERDGEVNLRLYECSLSDPPWRIPTGAAWADAATIDSVTHFPTAFQALVREWSEGTQAKAQHPAWARRGWHQHFLGWVQGTLLARGITLTSEPEWLRTWERSLVMRVSTTEGLVYGKAVPDVFAHEPALTALLAQWVPQKTPEVLGIVDDAGQGRHWLLLRDFGGTTLEQVPDLGQWEAAMRELARLQIALAPRAHAMQMLGCPHRTLAEIARQIPTLLSDTQSLTLAGAGLGEGQITWLRQRLPHYQALCERLAAFPIPETLEHGDFGPTNVAVTAHGFCFFDWSDSSIAHPFFSQCFFPGEIEDAFPTNPDAKERLRAAYLEPWTPFATLAELQTAFEIAQELAPFHHALRYHQCILPSFGARWQMERMIPAYLRILAPQ